MNQFRADLKAIKERARKGMEQGAATDNYQADRKAVVDVLNDVLASREEEVCVVALVLRAQFQ